MDDKPVEKTVQKAAPKAKSKPTVTNNSGYTIDFAGVTIKNGESAELDLDRKKPFVKHLLDAKAISIE